MQATRWANNSQMASKVTLKKRAGSLSPEKLAQVQQQLFYEDISLGYSPNSHHLRTFFSPDRLLQSNEVVPQPYNTHYNSSQDYQFRVDAKLSSLEATERVYTQAPPVTCTSQCKVHNHGNIQAHASVKVAKPSKASQLASSFDLDVLIPPESKKLYCDLEQLTPDERRVAMTVDEDTFSARVQQEIDCVGCVHSIHTYLNELADLAKERASGELSFEGFVIYGDRRIGFTQERIDDLQRVVYILNYHKHKNPIVEELAKSLNIKKKKDGPRRGQVLSRCLLHSKKPMPNGIWREALHNLIEHDVNEVASVAELDEQAFFANLQMHTKRRKFCSTCKENINIVYENMLDEANCSDCDDEELTYEEDGDREEEEEEEEEEERKDDGEGSDRELHAHGGKEGSYQAGHGVHASQNLSSDDEGVSDYGKMVSCSRRSPGSLLGCLKYCPERKKITIPLEMEVFMEFLSKAENGMTLHAKHANTKEAAQEELVVCIGTCLKERLQSIWRNKKSEELARIFFMKLVADCVVSGISSALEEKNRRLGHKTILEEYLNETEAAEQQRKDKLRQKRQKRKEKKKMMKQGQDETKDKSGEKKSDNEEDDEAEEEPQEKENKCKDEQENLKFALEEKAREFTEKGKGNESGNKSVEGSGGGNKKKKGKNKIVSPVYDKVSTDSNTPETREPVNLMDSFKRNRKTSEEDEEEKLEIKRKVERNSNSNSNAKMSADDERERRLLMEMGWSEEDTEIGVDEKEMRNMKKKLNEIKASRESFRKSVKERFLNLCNSNQDSNTKRTVGRK